VVSDLGNAARDRPGTRWPAACPDRISEGVSRRHRVGRTGPEGADPDPRPRRSAAADRPGREHRRSPQPGRRRRSFAVTGLACHGTPVTAAVRPPLRCPGRHSLRPTGRSAGLSRVALFVRMCSPRPTGGSCFCTGRCAVLTASEFSVVVLGIILLIIGLIVASLKVLIIIGIVLLVVGLILNLVPIGGTRRRYY